jgi:hypothetical protein
MLTIRNGVTAVRERVTEAGRHSTNVPGPATSRPRRRNQLAIEDVERVVLGLVQVLR